MPLFHKPDWDEVTKRWDAFWEGEILERPPVLISVPKPGAPERPRPGQLAGFVHGFRQAAEMFDAFAETRLFLGDLPPLFQPGFGPDQYAAFFGAELHTSPDSDHTNWAEPFVEDWDAVLPLRFNPANKTWQSLLEYYRAAAAVAKGRFLLGQQDFHGNLDALSAMRSPERLCMDLAEVPEKIDAALKGIVDAFETLYDGTYEAGNMASAGASGWIPAWSRKRFAVLQCDFACMISPAMGRRFMIPALEREAASLDHVIYHYDGPNALPHMDDVCAIKNIAVIQWVQGAGAGPQVKWLDTLKAFQARGKGLELRGTVDEVKFLHRELRHEKVYYIVSGIETEKEAADLLKWFKDNT
ncbi:MAG TPA: hypothetical protein P5137_01170 [Candidatus Brocadiia bacterium]|nr:hypothetical protein [Candidatus Brocadiia bacterium]